MNETFPRTGPNKATTIWVTTQFEALHFYKDAPPAVDFLKHPHRHVFHVRVEMRVGHMDRDVEFITFKHWLDARCSSIRGKSPFQMSCEMIADEIIQEMRIARRWPMTWVRVDVSEDGENGGSVTYEQNDDR